MLRTLVGLPGGPTVVAACHPTKNADPDNLLPRGGGAFVAEVDGNLVCRKEGDVSEMHWQGKFRGVDFDPAAFQLREVRAQTLRDSKGRLIDWQVRLDRQTLKLRRVKVYCQIAMRSPNTPEKIKANPR